MNDHCAVVYSFSFEHHPGFFFLTEFWLTRSIQNVVDRNKCALMSIKMKLKKHFELNVEPLIVSAPYINKQYVKQNDSILKMVEPISFILCSNLLSSSYAKHKERRCVFFKFKEFSSDADQTMS